MVGIIIYLKFSKDYKVYVFLSSKKTEGFSLFLEDERFFSLLRREKVLSLF